MGIDRRNFQLGIFAGLWAIMAAALSLPAAVYIFASPKSRKSRGWVDAGDISAIPMNSPEEVVFRRTRTDGWKVVTERSTAWVIRRGDKDVVALAPQCTHLGCAYHWSSEKNEFECPCHASFFSIDGAVLSGPAPRPLDRFDVKLQGNKLLLGEIRRQA
jgi:menaquinol-cytochrome c reductase iron-sulfur subunit